MLVGTKTIDHSRFNKIKSVSQLERLSISLVPEVLRHLPYVIDNQKYIVALYFRKYSDLPFKRKKELLDEFTKNLAIKGSITNITSFEDILFEADVDVLMREVLKNV